MNKTEKMTNRKALAYILDRYELPAEVEEKIKSMADALDRKSSAPRKQTATQVENEGHIELIKEFLSDGKHSSVADMIKGIPAFHDFSTPKVSALVKKLKDADIVRREENKGRAYFYLA